MEKAHETDDLLQSVNDGNQEALEKLASVFRSRLKRLASSYLRTEDHAATIEASDLIHEAYIALITGQMPAWENRAHFFGVLARLMRQILIQHARKRMAQKRISGDKISSTEVDRLSAPSRPAEFIELNEALEILQSVDPRQCCIVEFRFFGGLTIQETALALGCSESTVKREWSLAKAWLYRELKGRRAS